MSGRIRQPRTAAFPLFSAVQHLGLSRVLYWLRRSNSPLPGCSICNQYNTQLVLLLFDELQKDVTGLYFFTDCITMLQLTRRPTLYCAFFNRLNYFWKQLSNLLLLFIFVHACKKISLPGTFAKNMGGGALQVLRVANFHILG